MIKVEDVMKSYRGGLGCMCGCQGTYRVAADHFHAAGQERGYDYDQEDVSDLSVKMAVNKLNKLIDWDDPECVEKHVLDDYAFYETDTRQIVVYFVKHPMPELQDAGYAIMGVDTAAKGSDSVGAQWSANADRAIAIMSASR